MRLEKSLLTLVEKLRERIDVHGPTLRQNEALTRYVLVDPLLRELGWDTENPALVIPEYKVGKVGKKQKSADYALFSDDKDKPCMIVETKNLGTSLKDEEVLYQGLRYCDRDGIRYLSITNGKEWEIHDNHKPVGRDEKRIIEFDLKDQQAAEVCRKALALWELRVSGHIANGQTPVAGLTYNPPDSPEPPASTPQPTPPGLEWRPLSELNQRPHDTPPVEIQFPDSSVVPITKWNSILIEVAKWLEKNNLLTKNDCPIYRTPRSKRYAVSTEDVHSDKKEFTAPARAGSLSIETHLSGQDAVKDSRTIIKHVGQNPAQFKVRFSPP